MGEKSDVELVKIMIYLDHLKDFTNLREANEKQHRLHEIFRSDIQDYINFYDSDEWSDNYDSDFEFDEDGLTPLRKIADKSDIHLTRSGIEESEGSLRNKSASYLREDSEMGDSKEGEYLKVSKGGEE
jgi:hypothetical protein